MNNLLGNKNNNKVTQVNRNKYSELNGVVSNAEINKIIKFQKDSGSPVDSYFKNQQSYDINKILEKVSEYKTTLDEFPMTLRDGLRDGKIEKSIIDISELTKTKENRSDILLNLIKYPDVNKKIDLSLLYFGNHLDLFDYFNNVYIKGEVSKNKFFIIFKDIEDHTPSEKNTENDDSNKNELIVDYFNMGNNNGIRCNTRKTSNSAKTFTSLNENDYILTSRFLTEGFNYTPHIFKNGNLVGILLQNINMNNHPLVWEPPTKKKVVTNDTNGEPPGPIVSNDIQEGGALGNNMGRGNGRGHWVAFLQARFRQL